MRKVLVIDTSILCIWLDIPKMDTAGPEHDLWDKARVDKKIRLEIDAESTLVLPLATIIETGNHIAQARHGRKELADSLAELMKKAADNHSPWAAFSAQSSLWSSEKLKELAATWPPKAASRISIGDATILEVANLYASSGFEVEILTGDQGLKHMAPSFPLGEPRRRSSRHS